VALTFYYGAGSPYAWRVWLALEHKGIPYERKVLSFAEGDPKKPEFLALNPRGKVPAIVDSDGPGGKPYTVIESGAILIYLADKYGKFIGKDAAERYRSIEWVMFQMANVGPLFGQANHFLNKAPEKMPYAIDRYVKESAIRYLHRPRDNGLLLSYLQRGVDL